MTSGVGTQPNNATINNQITGLALQMRDLMQQASNLSTQINGTGQGLAYLKAVGFDGTNANPQNPSNMTDAQWALQVIAYFNTLAGCYFGTVQQGGNGGTGATQFNFHNALASLWNGQ
jgi:hypothetical protein